MRATKEVELKRKQVIRNKNKRCWNDWAFPYYCGYLDALEWVMKNG